MHVFVRHDSHRSALQPKYDSPFPVVLRKEKFYTIQRPSCTEVVSIDRLKPAYFEANPPDPQESDFFPRTVPVHLPSPHPSLVTPITPPPSLPSVSPAPSPL